MARIIRHKRLAIGLMATWMLIGIVGDIVMLFYLFLEPSAASKILMWMMSFIALLFVVVYEWVLFPVREDRRDFTKRG